VAARRGGAAAKPPRPRHLVTRAALETTSMNASELIATYTVVASAFVGVVVYVNSGTQRSVDELKKETAEAKKDTDSKFALSFIVSLATLATVLYMAAAMAAPR
jgi:uncharacterized membrane protein YqgA involved in biofilm formation